MNALLTDTGRAKHGERQKQILAAIKDLGVPSRIKTIHEHIQHDGDDVSYNVIHATISSLVEDGKIVKVKRGIYGLPNMGLPASAAEAAHDVTTREERIVAAAITAGVTAGLAAFRQLQANQGC